MKVRCIIRAIYILDIEGNSFVVESNVLYWLLCIISDLESWMNLKNNINSNAESKRLALMTASTL